MKLQKYLQSILRQKSNRILVLSAGSDKGGNLSCAYLDVKPASWELLGQSTLAYPKSVHSILEKTDSTGPIAIDTDDIAETNHKLSLLYADAARTTLAQCPSHKTKPHLVLLNRFCLPRNAQRSAPVWNLCLGDPQYLSVTLNLPVLADLGDRERLLFGHGFLMLSSGLKGRQVFLNIGIESRLVVLDQDFSTVILDKTVGPGNTLVNLAAKETGTSGGFDRDGALAQKGTPNVPMIDNMLADRFFSSAEFHEANSSRYRILWNSMNKIPLTPQDRLATAAALTARIHYQLIKELADQQRAIEKVWISGGGAHNLSLADFIGIHFNPVPVSTVEALGISPEICIPVAMGLSIPNFVAHGSFGAEQAAPPPSLHLP